VPLKLILLVWGLTLIGILLLGYVIPRADFLPLFLIYTFVFAGMLFLGKFSPENASWQWIFFAGLILRLSLLFATPSWSEDYVRFLWDGELLQQGTNPYLKTPAEFEAQAPDSENGYLSQLYVNLNSPDYYSVYPPLNQALFYLSSVASQGNVMYGFVALRVILILGEIAVFFIAIRLLSLLKIPINRMILYWLNPLVILEITANLHFEGLVLLSLLLSFYFLTTGSLSKSGFFWGISVGLKLLPLMLVPAFLALGKTRRSLRFWIGTFLAFILSFGWLLIDQSWINFFQSLSLYQGKFEFNASIYYLLREVGFWIEGYNTIAVLTKILSGITLISILYFSWKKRIESTAELMDLGILIYLIYLILQPVVHSWYILPAVGISIFTQRKTFLIWTFAAILSYQAYGNENNSENPLILCLEYGLVVAGIYLDYFHRKRNSNLAL